MSTYESSLSNYFTGMSLMASSMIKSPSYVTIDVYKKDVRQIPTFIKSQYTFDEVLNAFLYKRKDIVETVSFMMEHKLGEPISVYELNEKDLNKIEKESVYYIL